MRFDYIARDCPGQTSRFVVRSADGEHESCAVIDDFEFPPMRTEADAAHLAGALTNGAVRVVRDFGNTLDADVELFLRNRGYAPAGSTQIEKLAIRMLLDVSQTVMSPYAILDQWIVAVAHTDYRTPLALFTPGGVGVDTHPISRTGRELRDHIIVACASGTPAAWLAFRMYTTADAVVQYRRVLRMNGEQNIADRIMALHDAVRMFCERIERDPRRPMRTFDPVEVCRANARWERAEQ